MNVQRSADAGFTLIETLLATVLFVAVALGGFEIVRQLGWNVDVLAQRATAAAQHDDATAALRTDALSAVAVWKPAAACGDAVEMLQRDAGGASTIVYFVHDGVFVRARAAGPLDPCDPQLQTQTLIAHVDGIAVATIPAAALATHTDPVTGNADGTMFVASGIVPVAVDAHARAADGSAILAGNTVTEVTLDADPVRTTIDLVAGNRPTAYTRVLSYTCNGRCEANGPFPELRGGAYTDCTQGYDFANSAAYYVPATYGTIATGGGGARIVVTAYTVVAGYTFAFAGATPLALERAWPLAVWPPPGSPFANGIADPYPVNYAANAVAARGIAAIANDLAAPAAFSAELRACADLHADTTYRDAAS